MLNWFRYRYKLWRLHAEKKETVRANEKAWRTARRGKRPGRPGRHALLIEDDISQASSDYYEREAQRLGLQVPVFSERSEKWEQSPHHPGRWRLTHSAMLELRSAIRAEQREGSELPLKWLAVIAGVIVAVIGFLKFILGRW
jgi:hypothetical protein